MLKIKIHFDGSIYLICLLVWLFLLLFFNKFKIKSNSINLFKNLKQNLPKSNQISFFLIDLIFNHSHDLPYIERRTSG